METSADGEGGKKGEKSEGRVGDGNPACGERDGRKLATCVVGHGRRGGGQEVFNKARNSLGSLRRPKASYSTTVVGTRSDNKKRQGYYLLAAFAHSNLNTQIHGPKEAGNVPSSL